MIDGSVEPIASSGVAPSTRIAGVVSTAPPMPNMPDSTPLSAPTATVRAIWRPRGKKTEGTRASGDCYAFGMASPLDLHGVWVPLITPFDASGAVDVEAIERLCGEYLADGVAGIVALGTTGEAPALDADEKQAVIAACSRA